MSEKRKYKLERGGHGRFEGPEQYFVRYERGSTIELTDEEAANFGDRVRPLTAEEDKTVVVVKTSSPSSDWSKIDELTVSDVKEAIDDIDDIDEVRSLLEHEKNNKARKGVVEYAQAHIDILEAEE